MWGKRVAAVALVLCLNSCESVRDTPAVPARLRPNIVFVLVDDLSMNLLRFMPQVNRLAAEGTSFANYVVTASLCCPSRASILTGKYPHNTGVYTNTGPDGGFEVFRARANERDTFGTSLQNAGYRTAMLGKYLNGYRQASGYVPPGWDEWAVTGNAYAQYGYTLNENGALRSYPGQYLTTVLGAKASAFIESSAGRGEPFLVEISTFAPHAPYIPEARDAGAFPGLTAPRGPAFDRLPADPPRWLAGRAPLGPARIAQIDDAFRTRAQSVLSIDRMIGALRSTLTEAGVADDTVFVFSSDNGYHLGDHRLTVGKQTAFETDVRVPLIVAGPGVRAGVTVAETAENIDLRPTFDDLAGAVTPPEVDGRSLLPLLSDTPVSTPVSGIPVSGAPESGWRTAALVEHRRPEPRPDDPDAQTSAAATPPDYTALRTPSYTYVRYADGSTEFYDRRTDPHQLRNVATGLSPARRAALAAAVTALAACKGAVACAKAALVRA